MLLLTLAIVILLHTVNRIDGSLKYCRQTFGTNTYDLNRLSRFTLIGIEKQYIYALTPCALVPTNKCGTNSGPPFKPGMTACQAKGDSTASTFESSMGFLNGYTTGPDLNFTENPQGPGTGIVMTMRNAVCTGGQRLVTVTFICDKSVKRPTSMDVVENPSCVFKITTKAAGACPGGFSGEGLSGGTIFIIILLVLVTIYLVGGVLYNRFRAQQTGWALLPNRAFWSKALGFIVEGCKFTWSKVFVCAPGSSSSSTSYQSM